LTQWCLVHRVLDPELLEQQVLFYRGEDWLDGGRLLQVRGLPFADPGLAETG
jgi:hypothetical protein